MKTLEQDDLCRRSSMMSREPHDLLDQTANLRPGTNITPEEKCKKIQEI